MAVIIQEAGLVAAPVDVVVATMVVIFGGRTGGPTNGDRPWCQICGRPNHTAPQCWYNYDDGYQAEEKASAAMVTTPSYSVDAPWYSDMGTTDHITNDLDRLAVRDKYQGKVQIQTVGSILSVHRFT
jgi:hypothetical protein